AARTALAAVHPGAAARSGRTGVQLAAGVDHRPVGTAAAAVAPAGIHGTAVGAGRTTVGHRVPVAAPDVGGDRRADLARRAAVATRAAAAGDAARRGGVADAARRRAAAVAVLRAAAAAARQALRAGEIRA